MTLEELLEQGRESKSTEIRVLATKVQRNWNQGVLPSVKQIDKLAVMLEDFNSPCTRLLENGNCEKWLQRYGADCGLRATHPYTCIFAGRQGQASKFTQCPGYRTLSQTT
jgi:hypothetical protein